MVDPWEDPWEDAWFHGCGFGSDDEGDDGAYTHVTIEEAADRLGEYIIFLKQSGTLSAKQACGLAFWAKAAGLKGIIETFAVPPDGDHFSRTFDRAVARSDRESEPACERYEALIPCYRRIDHGQSEEWVPMALPLDCVRADLATDSTLPAKLETAIANGTLPKAYTDHVAVQTAPHLPVYPYSLYFDGVPITRHDAALCCYLVNLLNGTPFLVFVLRKADMCRCGCRGWCSIYVALRVLGWNIEHCSALGREPTSRHDGSQWRESDAGRERRAGEALPWRVAILFIKGDLMEQSSTLGFPSTADGSNPCARCWSVSADWANVAGLSAVTFPCNMKSWEDYQHACARCEIHVEVTDAIFPRLRAALDFDKRPTGARGYCLSVNLPELRLLKGDRLELDSSMDRLSCFHTRPRPFTATFWRRSEETMCRRRNPLFMAHTGVQPHRCMTPEPLHVLSLGVYQWWISLVWYKLMDADVFSFAATTAEVNKELFVQEVGMLETNCKFAGPSANGVLDPAEIWCWVVVTRPLQGVR